MAKRIMYSVLPHVSSPGEVFHTGGVVDVKALRAAVEGRKNLISLGLQAIARELGHYMDISRSGQSIGEDYQIAVESGNFQQAAQLAIKAFTNKRGWVEGFGGKPWQRITETLYKIINLDNQLDDLRTNQQWSQESLDAEIETMRQLIVEMNVFDGLSHNTASIMRNLNSMETDRKTDLDMPETEKSQLEAKNFQELLKMMDVKELKDPVEVFKMIEPTLKGSGDIHRFKDWVEKLRRLPEYRRHDETVERQMREIRARKYLIPYRERLDEVLDKFEEVLTQIRTEIEANRPVQIEHRRLLSKLAGQGEDIISSIAAGYLHNASDGFRELRKQFIKDFEKVKFYNDIFVLAQADKFLSTFKKIKFFLDAI